MLKNFFVLSAVTGCLPFLVAPLAGAEPQLSHAVYFKLKEPTADQREELIDGCKELLAGHEGTVVFTVGVLADELKRDVNDLDFDVSLLVVFRDKAAHDAYQKAPRHLKFVEEYSHMWASVRVFDSYLATCEGPRDTPDRAVAEADPPRRIPLPDPAASFAGMIQGKVVEKREGEIVLQVGKVLRQWRHSRADNAEALVGKAVLVDGPQEGRIVRFLNSLDLGETVILDVGHKQGEALTVLELTAEQRKRVD
jgi:hypothetical protein